MILYDSSTFAGSLRQPLRLVESIFGVKRFSHHVVKPEKGAVNLEKGAPVLTCTVAANMCLVCSLTFLFPLICSLLLSLNTHFKTLPSGSSVKEIDHSSSVCF